MSVVRVGSTKKFSDNWQNIFTAGKPAAKKKAKKSANAKPAKKKAAKAKTKQTPTSSAAAPPNAKKRKTKPQVPAGAKGVGSEEAKKSAAKRKSKTGKRKLQPVLQQKELF